MDDNQLSVYSTKFEKILQLDKLYQENEIKRKNKPKEQVLFDDLIGEYLLYLQCPKYEPEFSLKLQNELYDTTLELSRQNMLSQDNKNMLTMFTFYSLDEDKRNILRNLIQTS